MSNAIELLWTASLISFFLSLFLSLHAYSVDRCVMLSLAQRAALTVRTNYKIMIPLPPKIDPSVTMMQVSSEIAS